MPNIRKNGSYGIHGNISPTLRVLIEHEKKMNEISAKVEETEQKVERIRTRYTSSHLDWRKEAEETIAAIAVKLHSNPNVTGEIWAEAYRLLEKRANCKLAVRLCNLRNRVLWEKPVYEQMHDIYELDVIANDKRLKEIFINIIREMAIRYDA